MGWNGDRVGKTRILVAQTYGMTCWLCGREIKTWREFEVDHVIPRSTGGGHNIENLRPSHGVYSREQCNTRRQNKAKPPAPYVDDSEWFGIAQM